MAQLTLSGFADEAAVDLAGQITALRENRLHYVELRQVDGLNIADFDMSKTREVRQVLDQNDISVSCLGSPIGKINLSDPFKPHLEKMRRLCETAHGLNAPLIRIFSFYLPSDHTPDQCRQEVIEKMGRLLDLAAADECILLHENERDIYGDIPERCLDLHQQFGDRLRGILDPANYLLVSADPLAGMKRLFDWIDYLHIKDVRISDQRIVPAGIGDGSIPEIIKLFNQKKGRRFLSVEPHLTHFSGRDQLEKDSSNTPDLLAQDYTYTDGPTAFRAAVDACRTLLEKEMQ